MEGMPWTAVTVIVNVVSFHLLGKDTRHFPELMLGYDTLLQKLQEAFQVLLLFNDLSGPRYFGGAAFLEYLLLQVFDEELGLEE